MTITDPTDPYEATLESVGNLIMARTKDKYGNELGTFNADTRPTGDNVLEIIEQAADDVTTILDTDIPQGAYEYVRQAISLKAACIIERSYFPEQINNNRSPYPQLLEEYEWLVGTPENPGWIYKMIQRESEEETSGDLPLTNRPAYWFPPADVRLELGSKN